ncbi:hypothetical protein [Chitinimonas lacunae]|uniref:Uncharacterized protein n=1 Tax=Chitinimonas lacunae TaxID=1963018 RepID=A0ABV8MP32_9NEIS
MSDKALARLRPLALAWALSGTGVLAADPVDFAALEVDQTRQIARYTLQLPSDRIHLLIRPSDRPAPLSRAEMTRSQGALARGECVISDQRSGSLEVWLAPTRCELYRSHQAWTVYAMVEDEDGKTGPIRAAAFPPQLDDGRPLKIEAFALLTSRYSPLPEVRLQLNRLPGKVNLLLRRADRPAPQQGEALRRREFAEDCVLQRDLPRHGDGTVPLDPAAASDKSPSQPGPCPDFDPQQDWRLYAAIDDTTGRADPTLHSAVLERPRQPARLLQAPQQISFGALDQYQVSLMVDQPFLAYPLAPKPGTTAPSFEQIVGSAQVLRHVGEPRLRSDGRTEYAVTLNITPSAGSKPSHLYIAVTDVTGRKLANAPSVLTLPLKAAPLDPTDRRAPQLTRLENLGQTVQVTADEPVELYGLLLKQGQRAPRRPAQLSGHFPCATYQLALDAGRPATLAVNRPELADCRLEEKSEYVFYLMARDGMGNLSELRRLPYQADRRSATWHAAFRALNRILPSLGASDWTVNEQGQVKLRLGDKDYLLTLGEQAAPIPARFDSLDWWLDDNKLFLRLPERDQAVTVNVQ